MAIYLVKTPSGNRLVDAKTPSAAINFAVGKDSYSAEALSAPELAQWYGQGLRVENTVPAAETKVA